MPTDALPVAQTGGAGTIEYMDGTGWTTLDLRGIWRPQGASGDHRVGFLALTTEQVRARGPEVQYSGLAVGRKWCAGDRFARQNGDRSTLDSGRLAFCTGVEGNARRPL